MLTFLQQWSTLIITKSKKKLPDPSQNIWVFESQWLYIYIGVEIKKIGKGAESNSLVVVLDYS